MCHGLSLLYSFDGAQHVARTCLGKMTWNREQHCETADLFIHVYYLQQGGEAKEYFQERNSCQPEMCAESEAAVQDPLLLSATSGAPGKKLSSLESCKGQQGEKLYDIDGNVVGHCAQSLAKEKTKGRRSAPH